MIFIDVDVVRTTELIETITQPISTGNYYSILISHFPSSHFMLLVVTYIKISVSIHGQTPTTNIRNHYLCTCAISMRPSYHASISLIGDYQRITLFIDNHIYWIIQLIISISFTVSTRYDLTARRTTLPFHNTVIHTVSHINILIIIHIYAP